MIGLTPLYGGFLDPCGKEVTRSYTGNEKMNPIAGEKNLGRAGLTGQWLREQKLQKWHEQERQIQTAPMRNGSLVKRTEKIQMPTEGVAQGKS